MPLVELAAGRQGPSIDVDSRTAVRGYSATGDQDVFDFEATLEVKEVRG